MLVELADEPQQEQEQEQEQDSGMESLAASKGDTPERRPPGDDPLSVSPPDLDPASAVCVPGAGGPLRSSAKEYDDEPDETLSERLWGLTEMFPESVRNVADRIACNASVVVKGAYSCSRSVMWIIASSSVILFAPVIFEVERAQMEEMQKSQQKQVLLGTNAALAGPMPPMPR